MRWTSEDMKALSPFAVRLALQVLTCCLCCSTFGGARAQEAVDFMLPGLENRPYRLQELHPLTGSETTVEEGQVGMDGAVHLTWPDDGRVHFLRLECAGVAWFLPSGGGDPAAAALVVPKKGGAPFSARPGAVLWKGGDSVETWSPVMASRCEALIAETRERMAPELQQSMLWGSSTIAAREKAGNTLGVPIGDGPLDVADMDSVTAVCIGDFEREMGELLNQCPPGSMRSYLSAQRWELLPDLSADSLAGFRESWAALGAPDPGDAAQVALFLNGLRRFAHGGVLSEAGQLRLESALGQGDFAALSSVASEFWGAVDEVKTMAWFLHEVGAGAWGCRPSRRFSRMQPLPQGIAALLDHCAQDAVYGPSAQRLKERFGVPGPLPEALKVFAGGGDLMSLEEVSGSGPSLWLWVDAGAPSTVLQIQVLERMLADAEARRRGLLPRDLQWVVVDAGMDWEAYQRLVREAALRHGGLSKVPYTLLHTGGDLRWTETFGLNALPAVRHVAPGLQPTLDEPPLPGPDLIGWLARHS